PASRRGFYAWTETSYLWMLRWSMKFRWVVLAISIAVIASNVPLYNLVKHDYIPTNVDESEIKIRLEMKEGATLQSTNRVIEKTEEILQKMPGVELVLSTVGSRGVGGVNRGEMYVRLQD